MTRGTQAYAFALALVIVSMITIAVARDRDDWRHETQPERGRDSARALMPEYGSSSPSVMAIDSQRKQQEADSLAGIDRAPLPITVLLDDMQVGLRNDTTVRFSKCQLAVNGGVFSDGYVSDWLDGPRPHHSLVVGLMTLADGDERFNPFAKKVTRVTVRCSVMGHVREAVWRQ